MFFIDKNKFKTNIIHVKFLCFSGITS